MSLAKDAGFEGIGLVLEEEGPISLLSYERQMTQFRNMANDIGLELPSLATVRVLVASNLRKIINRLWPGEDCGMLYALEVSYPASVQWRSDR